MLPSIREPNAHERGQVVLLLIAAVLLASLCSLGLVALGRAAADRAAAQAAADAAALAGAAGGEAAARSVAAANGAELTAYTDLGDGARVVVERRGQRARAQARWDALAGSPAAREPLRRSGGSLIP